MIALVLAALFAQAAAAAPPAPLPKPLQTLAEGKHKDGTPILTDKQREALQALPEHTKKLLSDAADSMILGSTEELAALLSLDVQPQVLDLIASDNCVLCHADPQNQKPRALFSPHPATSGSNPLLNLQEMVSDVHFRVGLSCSGCHGGKPTDDSMPKEIAERWPTAEVRHADRSWIPNFCARCHADPQFMRTFNPTMPTDQLAKYKGSKHGQLLLEQHDSKAAQCVSCHSVHGIRSAKSRNSTVNPQRVPETCGKCHADPEYMKGYLTAAGAPLPTDQLAKFKTSVHGQALLVKGDLGAPSCTGCHGSHAAQPPEVAAVSQVCRRCHAQNGILFDGSRHKKVFEEHGWPECGQCHGHHDIQRPTVSLIGNTDDTLCGKCHGQYSRDDPKCNETALHFRTTLDQMIAGRESATGEVEKLAESGLDIEPVSRSLSDLDESLTQSKSKVHSFDSSTFDQAAKPGMEALQKARQEIASAHDEYRFRQRGLVGAICFIALIVVGIGLKLRELERRRNETKP